MIGWLRRGAAAASLASERGELWPPGMLASLVFLGWPLLLLIVAPPNGNDLEYFGVSLITSSSYPANVIALCVAAVSGVLLLVVGSAAAEIALNGLLTRRSPRAASRSVPSVTAILLLASLPVIVASAALVMAIVAVAPGVYLSPDVDTPILIRLAGAVLPYLAGVAVAVLIGQVFGGIALRLAIAEGGQDTAPAIRGGLRRLVHAPWGVAGVAVVGWAKDLLLAGGSYLLLHALWGPVSDRLTAGPLARPETLLLLVGFVGIWLVLLMVGGALHAFVSAWWFAELSPASEPIAASWPAGQPDPM